MGDMQTGDAATAGSHERETMPQTPEPLPPFLAEPSKIGQEISVTGKWIPTKKGGRFRRSAESNEMLTEWEDIHTGAKRHAGVLSTEMTTLLVKTPSSFTTNSKTPRGGGCLLRRRARVSAD